MCTSANYSFLEEPSKLPYTCKPATRYFERISKI